MKIINIENNFKNSPIFFFTSKIENKNSDLYKLTNLTQLLVIFVWITTKDLLLFILSILYILSDVIWHTTINSSKLKIFSISHFFMVLILCVYVFIKICFGFYKKKNCVIFFPIIILGLFSYIKHNYLKTITDKKQQYKIFEFYEPFVHSYIWLGLTFLNLYYPEFNIPFYK